MKTFKQYLTEATEGKLSFEIDPDLRHHDDIQLVNVDVDKVDDIWKTDEDLYIGPGGTGAAIGNRYNNFKDFLRTGNPIYASQFAVTDEGRVGFNNGRHRFAVLRDMGMKKIPVSMGNRTFMNAQKFGLIA